MTPRRVPIDFAAVAKESGMDRGKIAYSPMFGWCIFNTSGTPAWPDVATITPPPAMDGETVRIEGNDWVFEKEEDDAETD